MKISSKIIYGYGFLIVLMLALAFFLALLINQMLSTNRSLTDVNLQAARTAVELIRDMDIIEEYTKKYFALGGDPEYAERLHEFQVELKMLIDDLEELELSEPEIAEIKRLRTFWNEYLVELNFELDAMIAGEPADLPEGLANSLDQLKFQTSNLYTASRGEFQAAVERSQKAGSDIIVLSWVAAGIALVLACFVSFFIVQSISVPLRHLTQGTRSITQGKFFYRLDTSQDDEFSQLAKDFNTMTERLNELDQMKKDFVAHVSHELKAPLASMQETNQLLLDEIPGKLTEKQRRLLTLNHESGRRLSSMIGNLLDLSRMEAGVLDYELKSNDIVGTTCTAVEEIQPRASEKQIRLDVEMPEEPLMVKCDGDRILQVIRNLLANAVKFSPESSAITCRILSSPEAPAGMPQVWRDKIGTSGKDNGYGLVTVRDSGPGVPDPHKEKIFEKFHQVRQGKKVPGQGTGLGLAISKTIVEAHRGAIWMENSPDGGSVFYLLLPQAESGDAITHRESLPI
jgi:two-component system sensor histidine kinase GlrK